MARQQDWNLVEELLVAPVYLTCNVHLHHSGVIPWSSSEDATVIPITMPCMREREREREREIIL